MGRLPSWLILCVWGKHVGAGCSCKGVIFGHCFWVYKLPWLYSWWKEITLYRVCWWCLPPQSFWFKGVLWRPVCNTMSGPDTSVSWLYISLRWSENTRIAPKKNLDIPLLHQVYNFIDSVDAPGDYSALVDQPPDGVAKAKAKPKAGPAGLKLPKTWEV